MQLGISYGIKLEQRLALPYNTSGEIELFSLHKIKNRISGMKVHDNVKRKLINELFSENAEYRKKAKNKKMCITSQGLENVINNLNSYLTYVAKKGILMLPPDNLKLIKVIQSVMLKQANNQTKIIKKWFSDNYNSIIYDMNNRIPYPIIMKMREKLFQWALRETNPFQQSISDLIHEATISIGLNPENYDSDEEMWEMLKKVPKIT